MAGQTPAQDKPLEFAKIGNDDGMPYAKADFTKLCRINKSFALSFYQMDYQALVNALTGQSDEKPGTQQLLPVSKVVFDEDAFRQFKAEFDLFVKTLVEEGWS